MRRTHLISLILWHCIALFLTNLPLLTSMVAGYSWTRWMVVTVLMVFFARDHMFVGGHYVYQDFGVNYGLLGDNLPSPKDVVKFILSKPSIKIVRIYEPNFDVLDALKGSGLGVSMGVKHTDLSSIANSQQAANDWVNTYIRPNPITYDIPFSWISVGNEAIPGPYAQYVLPAIKNIQKSIDDAHLRDNIQVTTTVSTAVLGTSFPPSAGAFSNETAGIMNDLVKYLYSQDATPLMINVYPYFALVSDPQHISLDFALFKSTSPVFVDGELVYYNLYSAMVDAFISAMEKVLAGAKDFDIVISESGWPSAGGDYATVENAATYNRNLKNHWSDGTGTPKRPGLQLNTFIFALFNENQKPAGVEQNFGILYPDLTPVYPLW